MGAVRLGKIALRWCREWNVPVIERKICSGCNSETEAVKLTPPGDFRPAFDFDVKLIRETIDCQFGEGTGTLMLPGDKIFVLNKCPGVDRMDEVIADGLVVGTHVHEPGKGWSFVIRTEGAHFIKDKVTKSWLTVDDGAVPSMRKGSSAMAVGVLDADPGIKVGDEVIAWDGHRNIVATGKARMTGTEMMEASRGPAIKNRWHNDPSDLKTLPGGQTWKSAVKANIPKLEEDVERARRRIRATAERIGKPTAISFSGGKDSLATLLLVLDAGLEPRPKLIFIDTGIEFEETLAHIDEIVKKHELELITTKAGEAYFEAVKYFGPSAKDFRWCCKTCKLGPTASLIREHFPDGVLSFIGQRQYESESRYQKGGIWVNPWVPDQIGMSPIQKWTSLEVWLYIFYKKEEYNPLYARGFERIGCWLCPAADMAEHTEIARFMPRADEWNSILEDYARRHKLPEEWVTMGLWRWKHLSKGLRDYLAAEGKQDVIDSMDAFRDREVGEEEIPEDMMARVEQMAKIEGGEITRPVIKKALHCVGCGICISRCENDALELINKKIYLDENKCISCGQCLHPCPVVDYQKR